MLFLESLRRSRKGSRNTKNMSKKHNYVTLGGNCYTSTILFKIYRYDETPPTDPVLVDPD